ncbi:hypothetical protein GP486_000305 [Trichoglossum hirsutum]|uniref:Uncharacterized protein n=1 Tax=Trichoglossum hirsutum TaxID=265104 RepID=A0A9P8LI23_9PEZI|nr:hypothetical protein GP486_000305 [Trichoglossum hirsutum]
MALDRKSNIVFIPRMEERIDVEAVLDGSLSISIMKESQVEKFGLRYTEIGGYKDSFDGSPYEPIGEILLDLTEWGTFTILRNHPFYIVKDARASVIIGTTSPLHKRPEPVRTIGTLVRGNIEDPNRKQILRNAKQKYDEDLKERRDKIRKARLGQEQRDSSQSSSRPPTNANSEAGGTPQSTSQPSTNASGEAGSSGQG